MPAEARQAKRSFRLSRRGTNPGLGYVVKECTQVMIVCQANSLAVIGSDSTIRVFRAKAEGK